MADQSTSLQEAVEIMTLINTLAPPAIALVKSFAEKLQGKSVEEITAEADSIFDSVIAKAKAEFGQ